MGSYSGGKWKSLGEKVAEAESKKSGGPRSRGGKRSSANKMEHIKFRAENERQARADAKKAAANAIAAPKAAKSRAAKPVAQAKAAVSSYRPSSEGIPRKQREVMDVQNKIEAPKSKLKKAIQIGGLFGRSAQGWHLGRKKGKG